MRVKNENLDLSSVMLSDDIDRRRMMQNETMEVRKIISMGRTLAEEINQTRHRLKITSEARLMRMALEIGLKTIREQEDERQPAGR
jgi:hypothetical protein